MNDVFVQELLNDKRVREEINRHLWIESQKVGSSIGIEQATEDWMRLYALSWLKYHDAEKYGKLMGFDKNGKKKNKK